MRPRQRSRPTTNNNHARILEEIANTLKAVKRQPLTFEGFQTSTFVHTHTVCKANNCLDFGVVPERLEISRKENAGGPGGRFLVPRSFRHQSSSGISQGATSGSTLWCYGAPKLG